MVDLYFTCSLQNAVDRQASCQLMTGYSDLGVKAIIVNNTITINSTIVIPIELFKEVDEVWVIFYSVN